MKLKVPGEYTGNYGAVPFEKGVSTRLVSPKEANLLRAVMAGVEILEDDGVTVDEALNSLSVILPLGNFMDSRTEPPSIYLTDWNGEYPEGYGPGRDIPKPVTPVVGLQQTPQEPPQEPVAPPVVSRWTTGDLEILADAEGIAGLRALSEPLGIKGRSIADLIASLKAAGYAKDE